MPSLDPTVVHAIVAGHLHVAADDPAVVRAVSAASIYVRTYTGLGADPVLPVDDALTIEGLVNLSLRIFRDPGGGAAVGDPSFVPMFSPEDLAAHNHHYWDRLIVSWGIG